MPTYELPHLNCTTQERRVYLSNNYDITADDCIVLYGGNTVHSDANNRIIHDKYYQFSCVSRNNSNERYVITCGAGAARHLCSLIGQPMPKSFNPFIAGVEAHNQHHENEEYNPVHWNNLRRDFYYALQLFIIRYQNDIHPGTKIFNILSSICDERYITYPPQDFQFKDFMSIVSKFKTTLPKIIEDLAAHGRLRNFSFANLADRADKLNLENIPNIFR